MDVLRTPFPWVQEDVAKLSKVLGSDVMPTELDEDAEYQDIKAGKWPVNQMLQMLAEGEKGLTTALNAAIYMYNRAPPQARTDAAAFKEWAWGTAVKPAPSPR